MQIAEESLKVLRESQTNSDENNYMHGYSTMLMEVNKMKDELAAVSNKLNATTYSKKSSRVIDLENSLITFNECFFKMTYYKQEMITWKQKYLEKEFEFINFVTKNIDEV